MIVNDDYERDLGVRFGATVVKSNTRERSAVDDGHGQRLGPDRHFGHQQHQHRRLAVPGFDTADRSALQREPAGLESGRIVRARDPRLRLPRRPRIDGAAGGRQRQDRVDAARDRDQPARGSHRPGCRDSVPGIVLERRDDHAVQGGRAEPQGHAADHAGRPDHHGSARHEGLRRPGGPERDGRPGAEHRHPLGHDTQWS